MAIKKNQTGIMAAITSAANAATVKHDAAQRAQRSLPRGTIGSVRAGLGGIQDIDTAFILPWGPPDRLELELTAVNSDEATQSITDLVNSIAESGQQIPVLLRPAKDRDGYFEVVYGRRRVLACQQLGIQVKALIRTLGDTEALMAKGLENSSRADLSYYERARFAKAILNQGYNRTTACQALSVSKHTLSQLERITRLVPDSVGDAIGSAPETGRPKWTSFASMFENNEVSEVQCLKILQDGPANLGSDDRLSYLIKQVSGDQKQAASGRVNISLGDVGSMKVIGNAIKINLSKDHRDDFKAFFEGEVEAIIARYKRSLEEK